MALYFQSNPNLYINMFWWLWEKYFNIFKSLKGKIKLILEAETQWTVSEGKDFKETNLREVLPRESTSPMSPPSTIGVDNDLPSCQTCVTLGASDHKCTRRLQMVNCFAVEIFGRDDFLEKSILWKGENGLWKVHPHNICMAKCYWLLIGLY